MGAGGEGVPIGARGGVDPSVASGGYRGQGRGPSIEDPRYHTLGEHTQGGFAEYAVVPASNLLELPEGFSAEKAAASGLVFVTAWRALMTRAQLRAGERILITGASGGVGTAAVQIAVSAGAKVYALTGGAEKVRLLEDLGAHVVYDRHKVDFSKEVWRDTAKSGGHVVVDTVGESLWPQALRTLSYGGRLAASGATTGARGVTEMRLVLWKAAASRGSTMGTPAEFRQVMRLVFSGNLEPVIHQVMPLDETRKAHEMLEAGEVFGKIVLVP